MYVVVSAKEACSEMVNRVTPIVWKRLGWKVTAVEGRMVWEQLEQANGRLNITWEWEYWGWVTTVVEKTTEMVWKSMQQEKNRVILPIREDPEEA